MPAVVSNSACLGVTSMVAVLPWMAAPSRPRATCWSMASTRTSLSTVSAAKRIMMPAPPVWRSPSLIRCMSVPNTTSTRSPGVTNPDTALVLVMAIDTARMPGVNIAASAPMASERSVI